jgi:hypothetical protein
LGLFALEQEVLMLWSVLYTVLRRVLELVLLCCRSDECKDLEIVVLA